MQDTDGDGIADGIDRCPDRSGTVVDQGCPRLKYENLEVTPHALRLIQPVLFETGTPVIRSVSFDVLNTVVLVLREHPEITLEVQAHTDSLGNDRRNLELSREQAGSVVAYLVQNGIDAPRLTSQGYGETRPIESNQTSQGRNINRRVEFVRSDSAP
jgi:outer membrane protein OmpA-like peptidoglycan-associated protein